MHLLDGINRNDALENSLCLTGPIGAKIITRMKFTNFNSEMYCKASNYKGLHLKNIIQN